MKRLIMALCLIVICLPSVATNAAGKPSESLDIEKFIDDVVHERISSDEVM